ncbi:nudix (nucleoside diphosphate linked moiety X)-type motif 8 [Allomyces arbusculus]|nr:nudix (nucleoside diphosphate linked moiety X)-type motif 8 [Allomyces arbusculus]
MTAPAASRAALDSVARIASVLSARRPAGNVRWKYKKDPPREAAVMLPLCVTHEPPQLHATTLPPWLDAFRDLSVLLTVRSGKLRSHRGEVAFPGGMRDATDASLYEAACREMHEELGIALPQPVDAAGPAATTDGCGLLGSLSTLPDKSLTIAVSPFVTYVGAVEASDLVLNPGEVAAAFTLPLTYLLDPSTMRSYAPPADATGTSREISLGRRTYWPIPDETRMLLPDGSITTKAELVQLERADVPDAHGGGDLEVWGLTGFILKEFAGVMRVACAEEGTGAAGTSARA